MVLANTCNRCHWKTEKRITTVSYTCMLQLFTSLSMACSTHCQPLYLRKTSVSLSSTFLISSSQSMTQSVSDDKGTWLAKLSSFLQPPSLPYVSRNTPTTDVRYFCSQVTFPCPKSVLRSKKATEINRSALGPRVRLLQAVSSSHLSHLSLRSLDWEKLHCLPR